MENGEISFADLNRKIREKKRKLEEERERIDRLYERIKQGAAGLLEDIRSTPEQPSLYSQASPPKQRKYFSEILLEMEAKKQESDYPVPMRHPLTTGKPPRLPPKKIASPAKSRPASRQGFPPSRISPASTSATPIRNVEQIASHRYENLQNAVFPLAKPAKEWNRVMENNKILYKSRSDPRLVIQSKKDIRAMKKKDKEFKLDFENFNFDKSWDTDKIYAQNLSKDHFAPGGREFAHFRGWKEILIAMNSEFYKKVSYPIQVLIKGWNDVRVDEGDKEIEKWSKQKNQGVLEKEERNIKAFVEQEWILDYEIHPNDRERALTGKWTDDFLQCCQCTDGCFDDKSCACRKRTADMIAMHRRNRKDAEFKSRSGYEFCKLLDYVETGIFECNKNCACAKNSRLCENRVVQRGIVQPLQLRFNLQTQYKGWGVFARTIIPKGSFITTYTGVYMNNVMEKSTAQQRKYDIIKNTNDFRKKEYGRSIEEEEADFYAAAYTIDVKFIELCERAKAGAHDKRGNDSGCEDDVEASFKWFKRMEPGKEKTENVFAIDAYDKGNLGRFLNHKCGTPNVMLQSVFIDSQDLRMPTQALFATEDIKIGDELVWNYNYTKEDLQKFMKCKCDTPQCPNK